MPKKSWYLTGRHTRKRTCADHTGNRYGELELEKNLAGTYNPAGEYTYTDPITEEEIKATVGTGTRILKQSGKADNLADAERKIQAAVDSANHGHTTLSLTITGNATLVAPNASPWWAGAPFRQVLHRQYYTPCRERLHHGPGAVPGGSMTEEVIKDATERLAAVGVMASPEYWVAHYKDVKNLDGLILNMATRIKVNLGGTSITTVDAALDVLTKTGVINSPDYWATAYTSLAWLDTLLLKAANAPDGGLRRTIWQMKFSGWARFHPLTTPPAWCGWSTPTRTTA